MNSPKTRMGQRAPRKALRNITNGQPAKSADSEDVSIEGTPWSQRAKTVSNIKSHQGQHCRYSKSHGDLSKLRPKSPPLLWLPGETDGFHFPSVDDTQNPSLPNYNHQERQAIPKEWISPEWRFRESSPLSNRHELNGPPSPGVLHQTIGPCTSRQGFDYNYTRSSPLAIRGLRSGIIQPLDFCRPMVRTYPENIQELTGELSCHQLCDVTTTWSGLRYSDAQELYRIHQAFIATLEKMLASEIWKICDRRDGSMDPADVSSGSRMLHGISFCRDQFIEGVVKSLRSSEDVAKGQLGLVRLYLASRDCLVPYSSHQRDTSITVRVYHDRNASSLYPSVEAVAIPDSITFKDLNHNFKEGTYLTIIPQYQSHTAFHSGSFPSKLRYNITSPDRVSLSWLRWDNQIAGFRGVIPAYSETSGCWGDNPDNSWSNRRDFTPINELCIDVKAFSTDDNGSFVQFEKVVRARLNFRILPRHIPSSPYSVDYYQDIQSRFFKDCGRAGHGLHNQASRTRPSVTRAYETTGTVAVDRMKIDQYGQPLNEPISFRKIDSPRQHSTDFTAQYKGMDQRYPAADTHASFPDCLPAFERINLTSPDLEIEHPGSASHRTSGHASLQTGRSPAPISRPMQPAQPAEREDFSTFSNLPPPGTRSFPSQTFDELTQAWSRIATTRGPSAHHIWVAENAGLNKAKESQSKLDTSSFPNPVNFTAMQPEAFLGTLSKLEHQSYCREITQASADTPRSSDNETFPGDSQQSGQKRHAKSSLSSASPGKRAKDDSHSSRIIPSVSSTMYYSNYYSPLGTCSEMPSVDPLEATEISGIEAKHPNQTQYWNVHQEVDANRSFDAVQATSPGFSLPGLSAQTDTFQGMPTRLSESPTNSPVPAPVWTSFQDTTSASYPLHQYGSNVRTASIQSRQSRNSRKCVSPAPSSNIIVTVDDPQAKISCSMQAQTWSQLPDDEDVEENRSPRFAMDAARLSDEEKKAYEDAVTRSLDDIAGKFDDIFLIDSGSESLKSDNGGHESWYE